MKDKLKNLGIYKLYSLIFIAIYLIAFVPLSIRNLNIGFTGLFTDGFTQHVIFMQDYISKIKDWIFNGNSFPLFSFNLGLGADTITSYGYYGIFDPFNIIAVILPTKWMEFSYYLILFLKMYLSGLFFIMFAQKILIKNKWALLTSGLLYIFNSCMLLSVLRHLIFAGAFMIFPLVLLGAYKILNKEKPYLLIFSTLYALLSQFYLYAYVAFGFEIFVLIKSYAGKRNIKGYLKNFFKTNIFFLIGTLLGSFVLLSQLYAVLNNGRSTGNVMIHYSLGYYATLIFGWLLPIPVMSYGNSIGNFFAVILLLMFFLSVKKQKWLKIWIIIQIPLLLFSIFGYTLSLFSYVNNRWAFILISPLCLAIAYTIENIKEIDCSKLPTILKVCTHSINLAFAFLLNYLIINYLSLRTFYSIILQVIVWALFLLIGYYIYRRDFKKIKVKDYDSFSLSKDFIKVNIILMFLFNIGMCFCLTDGFVVNKYYNNEFKSSLINDSSFYRVSKYAYAGNFIKHANDSIYGDYSSTFFYNSVNNSKILDLVEYFNINNENANVGYNGMGKRYILETISGVKYYISKDSEHRNAPYNFSYYSNYESIKYNTKDLNIIYDTYLKENRKYVKENNVIYINNNHLPLGFVYNNYIMKSDLDKLRPLQRQAYLSKAVILESKIDIDAKKYEEQIHERLLKVLDFTIVDTENAIIKENKITITSPDNFIELKTTNLSNSEIYVELCGLENENRYKKTIVEYSSDDENWIETIFNLGENFYVDNEDHLLYLGYDEQSNERTIKIKFKYSGEYKYDSLKVYSLSMNEMINDINKFSDNSLNNLNIRDNRITGNINLEKDGILFLSIPYNKGFSAFVNGMKTPILNANIAYMALPLKAGENNIVLTYETPYFNLGLKISATISILLLSYFVIDILITSNKKRKNSTNN